MRILSPFSSAARPGRLSGLSDRLWTRRGRPDFAWRLDVHEDGNDRGMFLPGGRLRGPIGRGGRLMHYISAGGMRHAARHDAPADSADRRARVWWIFAVCALLWLLLRLLPPGC